MVAIAFTVACGGGVLRDLCIGAIPPAGLTDWRYLATAIVAALMAIAANSLVVRLAQPVLLFDSIGLALFAVTGAQKSIIFGHNAEVAVLLGVVTAVGGGGDKRRVAQSCAGDPSARDLRVGSNGGSKP